MKFFGWMQNKLNGKQGDRKQNVVPAARHMKQESREEFSDWPQGLLAIGTFGNNDLKDNVEIQRENEQVNHEQSSPSTADELEDYTPEEIGKLQKELTKLLSKKPTSEREKEIENLPLDRFLNCPSTLDVSRRISNIDNNETDDREDDIERTISVILGRCKDIRENKKKAIGKKSISFLLKRMFVCRNGFSPQPSLRDTLQESRMEKLLRTLLHKKVNPQSTPRSASMKKYLENRHSSREENEEKRRHTNSDGCKWVKTDSEYIVLEI
ncbi:hypothetical protein K2173_009698 [Erythroxylum novogranatense]|uniref:Uncharacterized protein n=1 Tax=Erythroxylum novogranatense TaxID=1862640 RepID=A0AAV8U4N0_9ROSI|nr:hypothetical protein K2173_009698 [Erythroxylum novogranatense]